MSRIRPIVFISTALAICLFLPLLSGIEASAARRGSGATSFVQRNGRSVFDQHIELIKANPNNVLAWEGLKRLAETNGFVFWRFDIPILATIVEVNGDHKVALDTSLTEEANKSVAATWLLFGLFKLDWRLSEFFKRFPDRREYLPTFDEEMGAFETMAKFWQEARRKEPNSTQNNLDILAMMYDDGLLDAYIYLQQYRKDFEESYEEWRSKNSQKIQRYFDKYVLVAKNNVPGYVLADQEKRERSIADATTNKRTTADAAAHTGAKPSEDPALWLKANEEQFTILRTISSVRRKEREHYLAQAAAFMQIGINFRHLKKYKESIAYHLKANRIFQEFKTVDETALNYSLLGNTYSDLEDYKNALLVKQRALKTIEHSEATFGVWLAVLDSIARLEIKIEQFDNAIAHLQQALIMADEKDGSGKSRNYIIDTLGAVYGRLFKTISWNLSTETMKESRLADFVNDTDVGKGDDKYGRRSPSEDLATFVTLAYAQNFELGDLKRGRLTKHVREEMSQGNLAPVVKYLFVKFIATIYVYVTPDERVTVVFGGGPKNTKGPAISPMVTIEAQRGNIKPLADYLRSTGLFTDEQLDDYLKRYSPVENDVTFGEVRSALEKAKASGKFVPRHITEIIRLYEEAYSFALAHRLLSK